MRQAMMFSKRGTSAAEVQTLINASIGGDQMDFVETCQPWQTAATVGAANRSFFVRFRVGKAITVTQMTVLIGTASGNIDLGLYQSDGTTLTRLAATGPTAAAGSSALQTINLPSSVTLVPRVDYYFGLAMDNATVSFAKWTGNFNPMGAFKNRSLQLTGIYPLPASTTIASTTPSGSVFWEAAS